MRFFQNCQSHVTTSKFTHDAPMSRLFSTPTSRCDITPSSIFSIASSWKGYVTKGRSGLAVLRGS